MRPSQKILAACVFIFVLSTAIPLASSQSWSPLATASENNALPPGLSLPAWNGVGLSRTTTAPRGISVENNKSDGTSMYVKPNGIQYPDNRKVSLNPSEDNIASIQVDLNGDNSLDDLWFRFVDTDGDGVFDCLQMSAHENAEFDQGTPDDNTVDTNEDENINVFGAWVDNVRIGPNYLYSIYATAGAENSVAIRSSTWWTSSLNIDVDDDAVMDTVNFCLSDSDSDGRFDTLDISENSTYGENAAGLGENRVTMTSDARMSSKKTITFGSIDDFGVIGPVNNPADQTPDFNVRSASWYTGMISIEMNGGELDNLHICLSDRDSDGLFDTYELSAFNDNFGQGTTAQLTDNVVVENNDERLTGYSDNVHLGGSTYETIAPVADPETQSVDFQLTSKSWYTGTITLHGGNTFNFVIWDPDSDGVFEKMALDEDGNESYSDDQHFDNYPASPIFLPRDSGYAYELVEFSNGPSYQDPDLVLRPIDEAAPVLSDPSPAPNTTVTERRPAITIKLVDQATDNVMFGIDESSIVMQVRYGTVAHSFSNGTVSYTPSADLWNGATKVSVTARDLAHNQISLEWSFTIDATTPAPFPWGQILIVAMFVMLMLAFVVSLAIMVAHTMGGQPEKEKTEPEQRGD